MTYGKALKEAENLAALFGRRVTIVYTGFEGSPWDVVSETNGAFPHAGGFKIATVIERVGYRLLQRAA